MKDPKTTIGLGRQYQPGDADAVAIRDYVNLKLAARGMQIVGDEDDFPFLEMGRSLLANFQERMRQLADWLPPADQRIHDFLAAYLDEVNGQIFVPGTVLIPTAPLILEKHGIARLLSLPPDRDTFCSSIVASFRVAQGVCHNPSKDRRTTVGVFHVAEGELPVPADKKAVPKLAFAHLLRHALEPPEDLTVVPYTSTQESPARAMLSLLLRPVVSPEVPGIAPARSMEVRFFAPGNLACNLDFVESIFGNAGDPYLPENNAALDAEQWTGHTGCVILAPHLVNLTKKEVGLPHVSEATPRQQRDGMCWERVDERYNDGGAFKITCRDRRGVIVTLIADSYFGYCKKEIKTQISYSANLFGGCEEEHAGGAIALPRFDLGEHFVLNRNNPPVDHSFAEALQLLGNDVERRREGHAIDKRFRDIVYLPENAEMDLRQQTIAWESLNGRREIPLEPEHTYVYPSGYKVEMLKPSPTSRWRLVGTQAEGTFCHKPCTVSGGGKSEISKSLADAMNEGPVIVPNFNGSMERVREVLERNYWNRFPSPRKSPEESRKILDPRRSLGSALRLLTPGEQFTAEHNAYLESLPGEVIELVLIIKRFYKESWGTWEQWRHRFHVDMIDGQYGYELKYQNQLVVNRYLRVGFDQSGAWRTFRLRKDFLPAIKLQREDDITASMVIVVTHADGLHPDLPEGSHKFTANCEYRFFQRPDDAIHRGYDKTTEADFTRGGNFFSNYEPLNRDDVRAMLANTIRFGEFTQPMQTLLQNFAASSRPDYVVSSDQPRLVNGKPSKNPRYLQDRQDLHDHRNEYLNQIGTHLYRRIPLDQPVLAPVNATLPGRRNNPPDKANGIRALAVYGPIHYQELPELFMDFVASLTGKSPSTTGAGSEGALTKGPFNALLPITDLNNALVSFVLTRQACFVSAAGFIGPNCRVDHDISLLMPEVWSRMHIAERDPAWLIANGMLEPVHDFEYEERTVLASRLGFRITEKFVSMFFGRVFSTPDAVFTPEMLRPEEQDLEAYADGVDHIVEAQRRVAKHYFDDGGVELACPPLKALLHIMVHGEFEGTNLRDPALRDQFTYEALVASDWYEARLKAKARVDTALWRRHTSSLQAFCNQGIYAMESKRLGLERRLAYARERLAEAQSVSYLKVLRGTIGTDPAVAPID